jgi:hypothetical protein
MSGDRCRGHARRDWLRHGTEAPPEQAQKHGALPFEPFLASLVEGFLGGDLVESLHGILSFRAEHGHDARVNRTGSA